jgi:hypothetical protein
MEGTLFRTRIPEGGRPNYCNILTVLQKPSSIALQSIFSDAVFLTYTISFLIITGLPRGLSYSGKCGMMFAAGRGIVASTPK